MNWSRIVQIIRTPRGIIPIILVGCIALGGVWFYYNFEKKEYEVKQDISPAARKNPLLAAQKYLQASGHSAESLAGIELFTNLPSTGDAIVVRHLPGGLSKSINDDLVFWVESGGHLLVIPNRLDNDNPAKGNIIEQLGVRFEEEPVYSNCGCPPEEDEETGATETIEISEDDSGTSSDSDKKTTADDDARLGSDEEVAADEIFNEDDTYRPYDSIVSLVVDDFPIQLEAFHSTLLEDKNEQATYRIDGSYHIEYQNEDDQDRSDNYKEISEEGAWLLQYSIGAGKITVLSEMNLFYNSQIGKYDHAFFLSWLVKDADKVWLLYASNVDSLLAILWEKVPRFWISFFMVIMLTLWKLQKRGGQLLRPEYESRHNIMTHIEASGMYNWQVNKLSTMIESNRKNILHRLAGRFFGSGPEQVKIKIDTEFVKAKTGISENELNDAFQLEISKEQDLIKATRALYKIQTLTHSGESTKNDN